MVVFFFQLICFDYNNLQYLGEVLSPSFLKIKGTTYLLRMRGGEGLYNLNLSYYLESNLRNYPICIFFYSTSKRDIICI